MFFQGAYVHKEIWLGARLSLAGAAVVILLVIFFSAGIQLRMNNATYDRRLLSQTLKLSAPGVQIGILEGAAFGLEGSWFGAPAIWHPPPIAGTDITSFDVSGVSQDDLISSLDGADICKKYGPCAADPGNPSGIAWGLQWESPTAGSFNCDSPATTTLAYREHILLPRWKPPPMGRVEVSVVEDWNALLKTIYIHEAGHVAISVRDIAALNSQSHRLPTCDAVYSFWENPKTWAKLNADQMAYHARLRADCRPEMGCIPAGWLGW